MPSVIRRFLLLTAVEEFGRHLKQQEACTSRKWSVLLARNLLCCDGGHRHVFFCVHFSRLLPGSVDFSSGFWNLSAVRQQFRIRWSAIWSQRSYSWAHQKDKDNTAGCEAGYDVKMRLVSEPGFMSCINRICKVLSWRFSVSLHMCSIAQR